MPKAPDWYPDGQSGLGAAVCRHRPPLSIPDEQLAVAFVVVVVTQLEPLSVPVLHEYETWGGTPSVVVVTQLVPLSVPSSHE